MKKFDTINVIPFIDIMLVLLAIVLTTATFINSGQLDIKLPKASSDSPAENAVRMEIAIDSDEVIYFEGKPSSLDQLRASLALLDPNTAILLNIDETVPFHQFIGVIDLLKVLKLDKVSVATQKAPQADDTLKPQEIDGESVVQ